MKNFLFIVFLLLSFEGFSTTYYVAKSNTCANDLNTGLAFDCIGADGPLFSLEYAITLLSNGDSIVLGQGMYFEHPLISGLQAITIVPYGDGMVTISGAMEPYTLPNNGLWTYEGMRFSPYHNKNFKVYSANYPAGVVPSATWTNTLSQNIAVDDNGRKMYTYADSVVFSLRHEPDGDGVYFDYDKMYISFADSTKNPNDVGLYISRFWEVFYFTNQSEVTLDGGPSKLIAIDHSARFGIVSLNGARMTLRNLIIKNGNNTIYEKATAGSTLIEDCELYGGHDSLWTWTGVKYCYGNPGGDPALSGCYILPDLSINPNAISGTTSHESSAVLLYGDTAYHVVRNCKIEGYFNGVVATGGSGIVEGNEIWNIYDDAIEPEGFLDLIIRNNVVWDAFVCHAGVTTHGGPVYVYENIYCGNKSVVFSYDFVNDVPGDVWYGRPMKYYGNSLNDVTTNTHFYYNTIFGERTPLLIGAGGCLPANKATNSSVFNNIFLSEDNITSRSGEQVDGIELRSNLFYTFGNPVTKYNCWNGSGNFNVLPPMPNSWTGNAEANPLFEEGNIDLPLQYFKIMETSPSRELYGFNLEDIPPNWPGAFDLNANRTNAGALEYTMDVGMEASSSNQEDILLFPNPTFGKLTIQFDRADFKQLVLVNSLGKVVLREEIKGEQQLQLDLSDCAKGLYFLRFERETNSVVQGVVLY